MEQNSISHMSECIAAPEKYLLVLFFSSNYKSQGLVWKQVFWLYMLSKVK